MIETPTTPTILAIMIVFVRFDAGALESERTDPDADVSVTDDVADPLEGTGSPGTVTE